MSRSAAAAGSSSCPFHHHIHSCATIARIGRATGREGRHAAALQYLKKHFKLVILSNVDRASFAGSNRRLQVEFDHVFTAQDIGSYKPDLRNFMAEES